MPKTETETSILTVRMTQATLTVHMTQATKKRLDKLANKLNKSASFMANRAGRITRATVVLEAFAIGMERLEMMAQVETKQKTAQELATFVVRLRRDEGLTLGGIADRLTASGYKPSVGGRWDEQAVECILKGNGFG